MNIRKNLVLAIFAVCLSVLATPAFAAAEIAVVRMKSSPFADSVYYAFAANAGKRFITFNSKLGDEAKLAKSIRLQEARVILLMDRPTPQLLEQLDPKIPLLFLDKGFGAAVNNTDRALIPISAELNATQMMDVITTVFPGRERVGMVYNPKLTKSTIDQYARANQTAARRLVLLKVDQPADVSNLMPTFRGKIDLFLLIRDATVIKAGVGALTPFLRQNRLPLVAPSRAFVGGGSLVTVAVDPLAVGRIAADVAKKALAGQRTFQNEFSPRDITVNFSLSESQHLRMPADQFVETLG